VQVGVWFTLPAKSNVLHAMSLDRLLRLIKPSNMLFDRPGRLSCLSLHLGD